MPQALGYLVVDGCEIFNNARTLHRLGCTLSDRVKIVKHGDECEALQLDLCGDSTTGYDDPIPYDSPIPYDGTWELLDFDADPPWYDTNIPASAEFLGVWVESFEFPSVVSRTAYPRSGALGGSTFGRVTRKHREMVIEALLVAESDAGLLSGWDWLLAKLTGCSDCTDMNAMVRLSCTDLANPTEGLWEIRRVALLDPPKDEGSPFKSSGCVMRKVSLTLAAGDPCRYKCPVDVFRDQSFVIGDCVSPVDFLCPDEVDGYRLCGPLGAPGVTIEADINVYITAGSEGMCPLRIRGALNPLGFDCADDRLDLCMELTVAGLGPFEKLFIDSSQRRVWWTGPSVGNVWMDGSAYVLLPPDRAPEYLTITGCSESFIWVAPASFCNLSDLSTITVTATEKQCT